MFELQLLCPEERVEALGDALEALDALSVSVEDADAHSEAEQALFGEPGLPPLAPAFANAIAQLSDALKWEAEEDLGRVVGDVAAHRIVVTAKSALAGIRTRGQALQENVAEYFLEENPLLLRPQTVADFGREVSKLRDDIERLEKRVRKLDR